MRLSPFPGDNVYFVAGGISSGVSWYELEEQPGPREQPKSWICHYCGSLNPSQTWKCSGCQAPRQESTKTEQAIWQPPVRVESHEESTDFTSGGLLVLPGKPSPPWWIVLFMISLWLTAVGTGLASLVTWFLAPGLISITFAGIFLLCYYTFSKIRGPLKRRYNWGTED